jgi:hypothetical protein
MTMRIGCDTGGDEAHRLALLFLPHYRNPTEAASPDVSCCCTMWITGFGTESSERMAARMAG